MANKTKDMKLKSRAGQEKVQNRSTGHEKNDRICPISKKCGACLYIDIPYEEELKEKTRLAKRKLGAFGNINACLAAKEIDHYRNKVTAVISHKKNELFPGIYEKGSHRVVDNACCIIEDEDASVIIRDAVKLLSDFKIKAYNEDSGYGLVRYMQVRVGRDMSKSKHFMLTIVISNPIFPSKNNYVKALRKIHPEIETIVININDRTDNLVLGQREQVLYGKGYIEDYILGKKFRISSQSFYQVNMSQTSKLYQTAIDMLRLTGKERLLDAYCGTGTIGIIAAAKASEVVGVEINTDAVRDAKINAKINDVKNITFYAGDAGRFLTSNIGRERFDAVIMDPPRSGATREFLESLLEYAPQKIVYISCGIDALARDLKTLQKKYEIKRIQPVDMFLRTEHVETVVCMSKKNSKPKDYVEIGVDAEDYYKIKEGK